MSSSFFTNNGGSTSARTTIQASIDDATKLATNALNVQFTLSDGVTTGFSALHYQSLANTSATNAATSATEALSYRNTANTHVSTALSHKNDAETAKTAAETAKTQAESARDDAQTAATNASTTVSSSAVLKSGSTMTGSLIFGDTVGIQIGEGGATGYDVRMFHDSSDNFTKVELPTDSSAMGLYINTNGKPLTIDSDVLDVASTGINVVGVVTADDLKVEQTSGTVSSTVQAKHQTSPISQVRLSRGSNTTWGADNYTDFMVENGYGSSGTSGGTLAIKGGLNGTTTYYLEIKPTATFKNLLKQNTKVEGNFYAAGDMTVDGTMSMTGDSFEIASSTAPTADNQAHPVISLYDSSDRSAIANSPGNGLENAGAIRWYFNNDAGDKTFLAGMRGIVADSADGEERGSIEFSVPTGDGADVVTDVTAAHSNIESPVMSIHKYGLRLYPDNDIVLGQAEDGLEWDTGSYKQYLRGRSSESSGADSTITLPDATGTLVVADSVNGNVTITGTITADGLTLGDNESINLNTDLEIKSSGGVSEIIETGSGNLVVKAADLSLNDSNNFRRVYCTDGASGAVQLYYGDTSSTGSKLNTTNTGVNITGTLNADAITASQTADVSSSSTAKVMANFVGQKCIHTGSSAVNYDFPDVSASDVGNTWTVINASSNTITCQRHSGASSVQFVKLVTNVNPSAAVTTLSISKGGAVEFVVTAANEITAFGSGF